MPFSCFWAEAETSVLPCFKKPCFLLYWPRASFDPYKERSKSAMCRSSHTILFSHITWSGSVTNNWLITSQASFLLLIANDSIGDEIDFLGDFSKGCFRKLNFFCPQSWLATSLTRQGCSKIYVRTCMQLVIKEIEISPRPIPWNSPETGNNSPMYVREMYVMLL